VRDSVIRNGELVMTWEINVQAKGDSAEEEPDRSYYDSIARKLYNMP